MRGISRHRFPSHFNGLVDGATSIHSALEAGHVVRVLGPPGTLAGLAHKSLELTPSAGGNLGIARDATTKDFASHLRFGDVTSQGVGPPALAAFQLASGITLQYYLARIDRQLGALGRDIASVQQSIEDDRYGRLEAARSRCTKVEQALAETGTIGATDSNRLDLAAQDLETTYSALLASVESACGRVEALDLATAKKEDLSHLFEEGAGTGLTHAQLFLYAAVIRHRVGGLQAHAHVADGPERFELAQEHVDKEHQEMLAVIGRLRRAFSRLHMPKAELDARWDVLGGPEKEWRDYANATHRVRQRLGEGHALLPPTRANEPFMAELRLNAESKIEAEFIQLDLGGKA